MNKMKFVNPATGAVSVFKLAPGGHMATNINKLVAHANSLGFVRAGKHVSHSRQEKAIIAAARNPVIIQEVCEPIQQILREGAAAEDSNVSDSGVIKEATQTPQSATASSAREKLAALSALRNKAQY